MSKIFGKLLFVIFVSLKYFQFQKHLSVLNLDSLKLCGDRIMFIIYVETEIELHKNC